MPFKTRSSTLLPVFVLLLVFFHLPTISSAQTAQTGQVLDVSGAAAKGEVSAPLALVEFSDLQCGYCARHNRQTLPELAKNYIEPGKVRYFLMDLPLPFHKNAFQAAVAARCAGAQGKLWEMHDLLFANQQALEAERLPGYAERLGLDGEKFNACLADGKHAEAVRADMAQAKKLEITATPIFVLGRYDGETGQVEVIQKITGAQPFSVFRAAIERQLQ